jgi:hypothetical protein
VCANVLLFFFFGSHFVARANHPSLEHLNLAGNVLHGNMFAISKIVFVCCFECFSACRFDAAVGRSKKSHHIGDHYTNLLLFEFYPHRDYVFEQDVSGNTLEGNLPSPLFDPGRIKHVFINDNKSVALASPLSHYTQHQHCWNIQI